MNHLRILFILLRPSLMSGTLCALLALGILMTTNWATAIRSPLLYDYFFGPKGLVTIMQSAPDELTAFTQAIMGGSFAYNTSILVLAAVIGLSVYVLLEGYDRVKGNATDVWTGLHDPNQRFRESVRSEVGVRFGAHVAAMIMGAVYSFFFIKVLLPLGIALSRVTTEALFTQAGATTTVLGFAVLFGALHGQVLVWRFLTLRVRLFGSKALEMQLYR